MPFINFHSAKPTLKLLIVLLSIIACGVIVFFVGLLLGRLIFWMDLDEVNNVLFWHSDKLSTGLLKYFQAVQTIGFFIVPGFFLYWFFSSEQHKYFIIQKKPKLLSVILIFLVFIVSVPLFNGLIEYNKEIEIPSFMRGFEFKVKELDRQYNAHVTRILFGNNIGYLLLNILLIAVLPAIGEELIFRGVLQKLFTEAIGNKHMAVILTAILFSAVHAQFYGFIPRFILGLFFGYLMVWGKTIWLPIIAHFLNNTFSIISYYLQTQTGGDMIPDVMHNPTKMLIIASSICTLLTVYFIKRIEFRSLEDA